MSELSIGSFLSFFIMYGYDWYSLSSKWCGWVQLGDGVVGVQLRDGVVGEQVRDVKLKRVACFLTTIDDGLNLSCRKITICQFKFLGPNTRDMLYCSEGERPLINR